MTFQACKTKFHLPRLSRFSGTRTNPDQLVSRTVVIRILRGVLANPVFRDSRSIRCQPARTSLEPALPRTGQRAPYTGWPAGPAANTHAVDVARSDASSECRLQHIRTDVDTQSRVLHGDHLLQNVKRSAFFLRTAQEITACRTTPN